MKRIATIICLALLGTLGLLAQDDPTPSINPIAVFIDTKGEEQESTNYSGSAPVVGRFSANPADVGTWSEYYEWRFTKEGDTKAEPYLIRYEQDTEYTFTDAGSHKIVCYAVFTQGNDTISYTDEYWATTDPITVTISESKLDMPNAFSPNGDQINDIYGAKEGWQSIVEFRAIIFNRWGQKIYEWNDPAGGWDGKWNGKDVKQGVYFVDVQAKGADGRKYHIRRDVNLLRGFRGKESSSSGGATE